MKPLATNLYRLCLLWLVLLPAGLASAQTLRKLDVLLQHPLKNEIVTDESYDKLLYNKQVALTGLAVQRGQTLGTSATIGDKSAALNVGLPSLKLHGLPHIALIANGRFNAEQGFTKLFSEENLRVTAGFGATVLLFQPGHSVFSERTKKDLHWRLRELRHKDKEKWADSITPYNVTDWKNRHLAIMANFIEKWSLFQAWLALPSAADPSVNRATRFYKQNGNFSSIEVNDPEGERLYLNYLDAEHAALPLLTEKWDGWHQSEERAYIWQQLGSAPLPAMPAQAKLREMLLASEPFTRTLESASLAANQRVLERRASFYDSLQQQVSWVRKWRGWTTVHGLHNAIEQPVFNAANRAKTYADVYRDDYWLFQAAYNGLLEGRLGNIAASLGGGTTNGLVFRKANLLTYQTSAWQPAGTDSALVVTQKSLYASVPSRLRYWNLQTQFTGTLNKGLPGFGITTSYEVLLARDTHAIHNITMGVIVPLRAAAESTLLFIPQVRARGGELPDRWSFGFTLTATFPTFLSTTPK